MASKQQSKHTGSTRPQEIPEKTLKDLPPEGLSLIPDNDNQGRTSSRAPSNSDARRALNDVSFSNSSRGRGNAAGKEFPSPRIPPRTSSALMSTSSRTSNSLVLTPRPNFNAPRVTPAMARSKLYSTPAREAYMRAQSSQATKVRTITYIGDSSQQESTDLIIYQNRDEPKNSQSAWSRTLAMLDGRGLEQRFRPRIQTLENHVATLKQNLEEERRQHRTLRSQSQYDATNKQKLEIELAQAQQESEQLVNEVFDRVDRFQPATDEVIDRALQSLNSKMLKFVRRLLSPKEQCKLSKEDWSQALSTKLAERSLCLDASLLTSFDDSEFRQKLMLSLLWNFIDDNVFMDPFALFGDRGIQASQLYNYMFPVPGEFTVQEMPEFLSSRAAQTNQLVAKDEMSAKWRQISVDKLQARTPAGEIDDLAELLLCKLLDEIMTPLGHNLSEKTKEPAIGMFVKATEFALLLAKQRAMFRLFFPPLQECETFEGESETFTSRDDAFDEGEEVSGKVLFLIRPALIKFGSDMGGGLAQHRRIMAKAYLQVQESKSDETTEDESSTVTDSEQNAS